MHSEKITLTREEIYDLVWSKPMREVAPTLNITDVGLAKMCKRLNIPRPKQGYWLRDKRDRAKPRALPPATKGMSSAVTIQPKTVLKIETKAIQTLPVISTKTVTHSLVRDCRKCFSGTKPNEFGRLMAQREDVQVSRASLARALSLLNILVHTVLEMGHEARYSNEHKMIEFSIEGEPMRVSLFEPATRSTHILTKKEEQDKAKYGRIWAPRWDHAPSGKLVLNLSGQGLYEIQTQWKDRKTIGLEKMLPKIIQGFLVAADWTKAKRREDEERERKWAIAARRRSRENRAATLTDERIAAVEALVSGRNRAQQIRECISDICASDRSSELPSSKRRLLRWAELLARHYDPGDPFELPRYKQSSSTWEL